MANRIIKSSDWITYSFSQVVGGVLPDTITLQADQIELVKTRKLIGCYLSAWFVDSAGAVFYPDVTEMLIFIAEPNSLNMRLTGAFLGGSGPGGTTFNTNLFIPGNQGYQVLNNIPIRLFSFEVLCGSQNWVNGTLFVRGNFIFRSPEPRQKFVGER